MLQYEPKLGESYYSYYTLPYEPGERRVRWDWEFVNGYGMDGIKRSYAWRTTNRLSTLSHSHSTEETITVTANRPGSRAVHVLIEYSTSTRIYSSETGR